MGGLRGQASACSLLPAAAFWVRGLPLEGGRNHTFWERKWVCRSERRYQCSALSIWVSSLSALVIFTSSSAEPVRWVKVRDIFSPSCEDPVKVMASHWGAGWLVAALSTASCFISACFQELEMPRHSSLAGLGQRAWRWGREPALCLETKQADF